MCIRPEFMFLSTVMPSPNSLGRNIDDIRGFDLWCIKEIKFSDEDSFDVDYQWFSSLWNDF